MTIILDTPEQINMWVLLSRRAQLWLQGKGLKTPGLFKWLSENGISASRKWDVALVDLNDYIGEMNGPEDDRMNYRLFLGFNAEPVGVFPSLEAIERFYYEGNSGPYIINRTLDPVTR